MSAGLFEEISPVPELQCEHVSYAAAGKTVLHDISFAVEPGELITISGPSGSGKSTLLRLLAALQSPTSGTIRFLGEPFTAYDPVALRRRIVYVLQTPVLFGETVRENMAFPFEIRHISPDEDRIRALLAAFQMSEATLDAQVATLSGGEKQRLSLIRSLLFRPEVLLLDEVTSALDPENTRLVEDVVTKLNRDGVTVLWITHSPEQSRRLGGRTLTIAAGRLEHFEEIEL